MIDSIMFRDLKKLGEVFKNEVEEYEEEDDKELGLEALRAYNQLLTLSKRLTNKGLENLAELLIIVMHAIATGERATSILRDIAYNDFMRFLIEECEKEKDVANPNEINLFNDDGTRMTIEEVEKMWKENCEENENGAGTV